MFSTNLSSSSNTNLNMNSFGQDYSSHHSSSTAMAPSIGHHFTSHYSGHQPSSMFSPSSFHQPYFPSTLEQNQFASINRQPPTHALHSTNSTTSFPTNPFHLNLNSKSNFDQHHSSLMPNDSYNSSGFNSSASSSSSSSPNSSSSSPDTKFNFLHTPQSTYLNYLNSNNAFSNQSSTFNSIGHQLQSNSNLHHNSFPSFNQTNKFGDVLNNQLNNPLSNPINNQFNNNLISYDEDDLHDEDEDDISISHYDMKAIMNYNNSDPLPGKTRTREKYRSVYTEIQRHELENEFVHSKYVSIKRKSELAQKLALSERQIKIWFQNRRAKERRSGQKKPDNQDMNIKYDLHPEVNYKYELQI